MRHLLIVLTSLLSLAPVGAEEFQPGLYTSRSENGSISWQLLFCMKQGASVYRVTGQFGDGAIAMHVDGRFDPASNRLNASMFKPAAGGFSAPIALIQIGGHWDPNSNVFEVTPTGLARETLTRDMSSPEPREPWIQITHIDRPVPQQRGALVRANVGISVRNVYEPFTLAIGAMLRPSERPGLVVRSESITLPIEDDDEYEFELSDLFSLTIPSGAENLDLAVAAQAKPGGNSHELSVLLDFTSPDATVRPVNVVPSFDPQPLISGKPATAKLEFALNAANTLDCGMRIHVAIEPFGDPGAAIPLPDHNFLTHGSPTDARVPDQKWSFVAPAAGRYRLRYTIEGDSVLPYVGAPFFTVVAPEPAGPTPIAKPPDAKAKLTSDITVSRPVVKVGESAPITVTLATADAPDDREVDTVFRIRGPKGDLVSERIKRYVLQKGVQKKGNLDLHFHSPGEYTIELMATGDRVESIRREAKIKVEEKVEPPPTETGSTSPSDAQGTYGLIDKKVGKAAPALSGNEGTWSGSITETTFNATYVLKPPGQGQVNVVLTWDVPPATLKPGDILELKCTASATASGKGLPYIGDSATWGASGSCEMLERKNAFAGFSGQDGKLYSSSEAKSRIKIESGGGRIQIHSGHPSIAWGAGGEWTPCVYTYEWNKPPMSTGKKPGEETKTPEKKDHGPGSATITALPPDDDEPGCLLARIEPREIVLFAGEPSKIVNVYISRYRRDTEERVEVQFPQKTDNWASLPGQIVVGGGNGSYWPPNMGTPEHADGYFLSARSTARGGTFTVWWVVRQKGACSVRLPLTVRVVPKPSRVLMPTKPAKPGDVTSPDGGQRVSPVGAASPFEGEWRSDIGPIVFTVKGNQMTGLLNGDVPLDGTIEGTKLKFRFVRTPECNGELVLAEDGKRWKGYYWEPDPTRGPFKLHIAGWRPTR